MAKLTYGDINDDTLRAMEPPVPGWYLALGALFTLVAWFGLVWFYQMRTGMGVAGISHPVGWGIYIANFIFWVGIAHSGTLISAILHLTRAKWRDAVSRSAEAMTVFAVMTAGLFPLIHLGRVWVFYYILPYPSQRQLWPNFFSPLLWDVLAVSTYLTVSSIFFLVGLIPDAAAARDRSLGENGPQHWRTRLYTALAAGWTGSGSQWRHYDRSYLFFAALATPLVISVHSVVSWDFAVSLLPGWHTTIFAPYFVAGAIHSGLAMVFTLMIPMRRLLRLERLVTIDHLEKMAQTLLVTTAIIGYTYVIEPFIAWYSGDIFEGQFALWRATTWGRGLTWMYWSLFLFNVFIPLSLLARRARRSLTWLFIVSIAINIGMFFERLHIVPASMAHDFMPHNWGAYMPTWVEFSITAGTASFFFSLFLLFSKLLPTIPLTDLKGHDTEESGRSIADCKAASKPLRAGSATWVLAVFGEAEKLLQAARSVCEQGFRSEVFTPVKMPELHRILRHRKSPVRFWTLAGALFGVTAGFSLAIGAASVNHLIVGGKPPVALIPYVIIGFEMMVLFGSLFNLAGLLNHTRMLRQRPHPAYDRRFSRDKFGLLVECGAEEIDKVRQIMAALAPEETHVQR